MTRAAVAGVGMHEFGRHPSASLKDLARVAIVRALDDAGLGVKEVEAVYSANALAGLLQGQEQIRGQSVLRDVGIERVPVVNVENACAGASTAFAQAATAIRAGDHRVVLAVGFEKMFVDDTARSLDALESAADVELVAGLGLQFTAIYAMRVRARLDAGALEPRHLLDVTVKSHRNGSLNPYAQYRRVVTADEVAESRPIADPLTLLMCSSISDGAAAAVLVAEDHPAAAAHPRVVVRASALASGYAHSRPGDLPIVTLCAEEAYRRAGIEPDDLDVAEVHDAMAPGELLYYEQLGFCETGEAGDLLDSGATAIGGSLPVNPSGGLCSRGHPVGATGLAQIAEVVWQLRGEAGPRQVGQPRLGLTQNSGGWLEGDPAAVAIHVLERDRAVGLSRAETAAGSRDRPRLRDGVLVGSRCNDCGARSWPARAVCARCGRDDLAAADLPATGSLLSYTSVWVERNGFPTPYVLGQVDFGEGAVVFGHVRGLAEGAAVPLPVRVAVPTGTEGGRLSFWFEPGIA